MANNTKKKSTLKFSVAELTRIAVALLNNGANKKFASNVQRLFKLCDNDNADYEKTVRYYIINQITDIILKNDISSKDSICSFIDCSGMYGDKIAAILSDLQTAYAPENEIELLDKKISQQLKYNTIVENADKLGEMLSNISTENYTNLDDAVNDLESTIDKVNREIKSSRESIESSKKDMNLSSSGFLSYLGKIIEKEKNPSTRIKTGSQYLNAMLSGGYEKGRLYVALGVAKGWKSGFLLSTAIWAKKYNTLTPHNPLLKPVIVYLSMENTNDETLIRLWNNQFGDNNPITNYDETTAARMLETAGIFTPNDPKSPEILMWYRPNRSISTVDLNIMLEDLKKDGRECCLLVLDYLKRIRPSEPNKDLRLELANITNELKTIAMEQDIPVVSAMQLNYQAIRKEIF